MSDKSLLYVLGGLGAYLLLTRKASASPAATPVYGTPFSTPVNGNKATAAGAASGASNNTGSILTGTGNLLSAIASIFGGGKSSGGGGGGGGVSGSGGAGRTPIGSSSATPTDNNSSIFSFGSGTGTAIFDKSVGSSIYMSNADFSSFLGDPYAGQSQNPYDSSYDPTFNEGYTGGGYFDSGGVDFGGGNDTVLAGNDSGGD